MTGRAIPLFVIALVTGCICSAAAAHAQSGSTDGLGRLDAATASQVRSVIEAAVAQGIPGEPLTTKALEGQSKGASGERIVLAVRNLTFDLATARTALGAGASDAELVAGAGALRAGATPEVLSRLKAARGTHSVLLPLAALTDLVARGVPVGDAVQTVLALAHRKAAESDYRTQGMTAGPPAGAVPSPAIPRPIPAPSAPGVQPPVERPSPGVR